MTLPSSVDLVTASAQIGRISARSVSDNGSVTGFAPCRSLLQVSFTPPKVSNMTTPRGQDTQPADSVGEFWRHYMEFVATPAPFDAPATRKRLEEFATTDEAEQLLGFISGSSLVPCLTGPVTSSAADSRVGRQPQRAARH